ncbi:MAG: shufflon system plasmid conjugative transfer pilus tip adhesin PilV [Proteobacteria bacterium]|nr:shufflon system plasmid conjugative transfer pilus tip adhesin PilV [Pseudomonadota bacterium]
MISKLATFTSKREGGFTLLELLLSIGLLAVLLAGMYKIFDGWMQRAINRYAASDMLRVQKATEDYVLANFETFKTAPLNTFVEVNINDLKTFNYLPTGYVPRNTFKQSIRVFRRTVRVNKLTRTGANAVDASGNPIYIFSVEVVTVSDNPAGGTLRVPNQRLLDTAQAGGPAMGVITNLVLGGTTFTGRATSLFSEWYVDLVGLSGVGYAATPDADGGYLAAYGIVNAEGTEANDAWLYRVDVDARPELNRMETDLLMNGNQLQSVGTIIADKMNVTGSGIFRGVAQGLTSETAQAMTVEQAMQVGGTESRIYMKDTSGGCSFSAPGAPGTNRTLTGAGCTISGGEVQVISGSNDAIMRIGNLTADGSAITDITNVTNQTDSRGISTFATLNGANLTAQSQLITPLTNVTGATVTTDQLQAGNMAVGANSQVQGSLTTARVQPEGVNDFTTTRMQVFNQATFGGEIRANALQATRNLYIENMFFNCANPGYCYTDAVMGGRQVQCTPYNGRTYCEPRGSFDWTAQDVRETCANGPGADHYNCTYRQISTNTLLGNCTFRRSTGASGQAYHIVDVCS